MKAPCRSPERSHLRMNTESVRAHDQETNLGYDQLAEEITKVVDHRSLGRSDSASVVIRIGIVARVYCGTGAR
jgi:hypothetical protein